MKKCNVFQIPRSSKWVAINPVSGVYNIARNQMEAIGLLSVQRDAPRALGGGLENEDVVLTVLFSTKCPLDCSFCFMQECFINSELSVEKVVAEIKKIPKLAQLNVLGGEPLVEISKIKEVVESGACPGRVNITTNGVLLLEEFEGGTILDWLASNGVKLTISLDGPRNVQEISRPSRKDGVSSYDAIMDALVYGFDEYPEYMQDNISIRGTFKPYANDLLEQLKFLNGIRNASGISSGITLEPDMYRPDEDVLETVNNYKRIMLEAADWFISETKSNNAVSWTNMVNGYIIPITTNAVYTASCSAGNKDRLVTIGPDGKHYACHRIKDCETVNDADAEWWDKTSKDYREHCSTCGLRSICGGGCRAIASQEGDRDRPDPYYCELVEINIHVAFYILESLGVKHFNKLLQR